MRQRGAAVRLAASRRTGGVLALILVAQLLFAYTAVGQTTDDVPDQYQAGTSATGLSVVQFKSPNPLPVGPGAFFTLQSPEVAGQLSTSNSRARASAIYPGPAIAGISALLCTAGMAPACGQEPPPVLVEAEYPNKPTAQLATQSASISDPSAPAEMGAGSGSAAAERFSNRSDARMGGYSVGPPDPAREAVLTALAQTVDQIPGAARAPDTSLLSMGGATTTQVIEPVGNGVLRAEAISVISDIKMMAGLVTVDSVKVTAFVISDGDKVLDVGSTTETSGVLIGGFEGSIGPEGIGIGGEGDGGATRDGLTGVAAQVSDALALAVDKLDIEIRDGTASQQPDGSAAAADGMLLSVRNSELTDTAPPQVPGLCGATGTITDPLAGGGLILPPLCAVPDATGTQDRYEFQFGTAAAALSASTFAVFDFGTESSFTPDDPVVSGGSAPPPSPSSGFTPAPSSGGAVVTSGGASAPVAPTPSGALPAPALIDRSAPSFLAREAAWLGNPDTFNVLYLSLALSGTFLALLTHLATRRWYTARIEEGTA